MVSRNLYRTQGSRCFNAVLMSKHCATSILSHGALTDDFLSIDHLFNRYIPTLGLNAFYAHPPLAYEKTKSPDGYPCPRLPLQVRMQLMFQKMCGGFRLGDIDDAISRIREHDEFDATLFGTEAWNRLSIEEVFVPKKYYKYLPNDSKFLKWPTTVLSYGTKLERGRLFFKNLGIPKSKVHEISYESVEKAYDEKEYLSKQLFHNARTVEDVDTFSKMFPGKKKGYLLSTLNQFTVLEMLANGTLPDEILVLEDDIRPVPNFLQKLGVIRQQLSTMAWDVSLCLCIRVSTFHRCLLYSRM